MVRALIGERDFHREEIEAILALEADGVRCPSTFDGGAYLAECVGEYLAAVRAVRRG